MRIRLLLKRPKGALAGVWLGRLSGLSIGLQTKESWFDSQSQHMHGLLARSPVGGMREATTH